MQDLDTKLFASNLYWPDRHWSFVMVPDDRHGFDFVADNAVQVDKRAAAWFFFTFYPKVLTDHAGTVYLAPIVDSPGQPLRAGKTYTYRPNNLVVDRVRPSDMGIPSKILSAEQD